ncbi:DNA repair protein RecN [Pseudokordiimonas caeni]|uniref:DNA repair protein RecN n=1 Tax=Pseudokordiimonas caeni TaxID=2997908 RepID=UPI002811F1D7|nr:DNA repair protein RecN [Pseudokordiimonas caeni]
MLANLSIRDIVLIDRLDLALGAGLNVLTGETGAGKSILLDALGLALGARADRALVRQGAEQGSVTAAFDLAPDHVACGRLADNGMDHGDGQLILRRQITTDGRSRAWVNDQPVSQTLLAEIGTLLVEIHGQHDDRGLLDPAAHRDLLDAFAGNGDARAEVAAAHEALRHEETILMDAEASLVEARRDEDFLRHAVEELVTLDPEPGEEEKLDEDRTLMMQGEKLMEELGTFHSELTKDGGVDATVRGVLRRMLRQDGPLAVRLEPVSAALDRAAIELGEAVAGLEALQADLEFDPAALERIEERLFEIRRLARKHGCPAGDLPGLKERLQAKLAALDAGDEAVLAAKGRVAAARAALKDKVAGLSARRQKAAAALDAAVMAELPPLKLEKAQFHTAIEALPEHLWGAAGGDSVAFEVKTNPGTPFGPLVKIASGGELARFILALKVVLAKGSSAPTMVFDEVDRGIGGATADAVGERLKRLSTEAQVLVVTHSPQVAARGGVHFRIEKADIAGGTRTSVVPLAIEERREEVARMLAGAEITPEARAAADRLLEAV